MAGHNIARLSEAASGMSPGDVDKARDAWVDGSSALFDVEQRLRTAAKEVKHGFGDNSEAGQAAHDVLISMRDDTVKPRREDMTHVSTALEEVSTVMLTARDTNHDMPPAPGPQAGVHRRARRDAR